MEALSLRRESLKGIYTILSIIAALVVAYMAHSEMIVEHRYIGLWSFFYFIGILYTVKRLSEGLIFHPFVLLGSAYAFMLVIGAFIYESYKPHPLKDYPFNLIGIGYAALLSGVLLGESLSVRLKNPQYNNKVHNLHLIYALLAFALLVNLFLFAKNGGSPLFAARPNIAKTEFQKGNGIYNLFYMGLPVFSMFLLYDCYYRGKNLMWAHGFLFIAVSIILLRGYRSNTLICIGEYVSLYLLLHQKKISLKKIVGGGLMVVVFVSALGAFRRSGEDSGGMESIKREFYVVTTHRPAMVAVIARNFTESMYFHGSLYYHDFKKFLPGEQHHSNVEFKYTLFSKEEAEKHDMDDTAGITPSLTGESYMNFGRKGAFWVLFILGFVLARFYKLFLAKPNFLIAATYLTIVFNLSGSIQSGLGLKFVHLTQILFFVVLISFFYQFRLRKGGQELFGDKSV